jgi:hypothetical protein
MGAGLAAIGTWWASVAQREREEELLFVGEQFRKAIRSYYDQSPEATRVFPSRIEDLLEDRRLPTIRRHLRRVYADPFTGRPDWELIRMPDGRIQGVSSRSNRVPYRRNNLPDGLDPEAATYAEWRFIAQPGAAAAAPGATGAVTPGGSPGPASIEGGRPSSGGIPPEPTPAAPTPAPRPRPNQQCYDQREADNAVCYQLRSTAPAMAAACTLSANIRFGICLRGGVAPPLAGVPPR